VWIDIQSQTLELQRCCQDLFSCCCQVSCWSPVSTSPLRHRSTLKWMNRDPRVSSLYPLSTFLPHVVLEMKSRHRCSSSLIDPLLYLFSRRNGSLSMDLFLWMTDNRMAFPLFVHKKIFSLLLSPLDEQLFRSLLCQI